jgi:hypothetical protein
LIAPSVALSQNVDVADQARDFGVAQLIGHLHRFRAFVTQRHVYLAHLSGTVPVCQWDISRLCERRFSSDVPDDVIAGVAMGLGRAVGLAISSMFTKPRLQTRSSFATGSAHIHFGF